MSTLLKIFLYALLIIGVAYVVPGISVVSFWPTAVLVGLVFALMNAVIRAFLPDNIIFGIIAVIANAVAFWYISVWFAGFSVATYLAAFLGSLIAAAGVWLINEIF